METPGTPLQVRLLSKVLSRAIELEDELCLSSFTKTHKFQVEPKAGCYHSNATLLMFSQRINTCNWSPLIKNCFNNK